MRIFFQTFYNAAKIGFSHSHGPMEKIQLLEITGMVEDVKSQATYIVGEELQHNWVTNQTSNLDCVAAANCL